MLKRGTENVISTIDPIFTLRHVAETYEDYGKELRVHVCALYRLPKSLLTVFGENHPLKTLEYKYIISCNSLQQLNQYCFLSKMVYSYVKY